MQIHTNGGRSESSIPVAVARAPWEADRTASHGAWHWLFWLTCAWGVACNWLAPHLPLVDLPQHAGQVALLRDLFRGTSPWAEVVRVNLLTPYLVGYGAALPLAMVMPIAVALKLLLSLAYLASVCMCVRIGRQLQVDRRLNWLFLLSGFGFAYGYGFFTYLVAAPIGLWFLSLAIGYRAERSTRRGLACVAVGLLLLASHGLMFLFAYLAGALMLVTDRQTWRRPIRSSWPFVVLGLACLTFLVLVKRNEANVPSPWTEQLLWALSLRRVPQLLSYTLGIDWSWLHVALVLVFLAAPWLCGLRIDRRNPAKWACFTVVVLIMLFMPYYAIQTYQLHSRVALFFLPAYAWMFTRPTAGSSGSTTGDAVMASRDNRPPFVRLVVPLLAMCCWVFLAERSVRTLSFARETEGIDAIIAKAEPGQRALALIFDKSSVADGGGTPIYLHYASWYQAERQGFVDFNFAWFPPQVARFQLGKFPAVKPGFLESPPYRFDWVTDGGSSYRYFFVRSFAPLPADLFAGAPCPPAKVLSQGDWTLFERNDCPRSTAP